MVTQKVPVLKRARVDEKQRSITSLFGFQRSTTTNATVSAERELLATPGVPTGAQQPQADNPAGPLTAKKKKPRKFFQSWAVACKCPGLLYKDKRMFCKTCIDQKEVNPFTLGAKKIEKASVEKHVKSASHQKAILEDESNQLDS